MSDKKTNVEATTNSVTDMASEITGGISAADLLQKITKDFPNIEAPDPIKSFVEKLTEQRSNNDKDHQR